MRKPGEILEYEKQIVQAPVQVPGRVLEDVLIPAYGYLRGRAVKKGQVLRIVDVEGQQVPDVIFFDAQHLKNTSSCMNTMLVHKRWKIGKGDAIISRYGQPMATIIEDTVGMHMFFGGMCNSYVNKTRYGVDGTHSCLLNFTGSMAAYGFSEDDIPFDACFCPFMNMEPKPDGTLEIHEPPSKAGDSIDFQAEMDLIVSISNCPSERNPCNAWNPTPLRVVIWEKA